MTSNKSSTQSNALIRSFEYTSLSLYKKNPSHPIFLFFFFFFFFSLRHLGFFWCSKRKNFFIDFWSVFLFLFTFIFAFLSSLSFSFLPFPSLLSSPFILYSFLLWYLAWYAMVWCIVWYVVFQIHHFIEYLIMSLHFYFYFSIFLVFFVFSSYHLLLIFPFSVDVSSCLFFLFPLSLLCTYSYTFARSGKRTK